MTDIYTDDNGDERCDNCGELAGDCLCACVVCGDYVQDCACEEGPTYPYVADWARGDVREAGR